MGLICPYCGTDNGITQYHGKQCRKCGKIIVLIRKDYNTNK